MPCRRTSFPGAAIAVVLATLASACTSAPPTRNDDVFVTRIYDDGTKIFSYSFGTGERLQALSPLDYGEGFTDGRQYYTPESLRKKNRSRLRHRVEDRLEQTGFCRDGYFILENYVSYGGGSARGECREGATAEDRERFPNPE